MLVVYALIVIIIWSSITKPKIKQYLFNSVVFQKKRTMYTYNTKKTRHHNRPPNSQKLQHSNVLAQFPFTVIEICIFNMTINTLFFLPNFQAQTPTKGESNFQLGISFNLWLSWTNFDQIFHCLVFSQCSVVSCIIHLWQTNKKQHRNSFNLQ